MCTHEYFVCAYKWCVPVIGMRTRISGCVRFLYVCVRVEINLTICFARICVRTLLHERALSYGTYAYLTGRKVMCVCINCTTRTYRIPCVRMVRGTYTCFLFLLFLPFLYYFFIVSWFLFMSFFTFFIISFIPFVYYFFLLLFCLLFVLIYLVNICSVIA